jgi:transposase
MNPTDNYIENFLNIKDPSLNFVDCSRTTYKGKKVIMCTAIAELDTCPNCESADSFVYNGFKVVYIPYISADQSNPVIIKIKKHGIFCKNCEAYSYPSTQIVDKYCHISNAVKRKIIVGLTKDHSMTSIAEENGVSVATVQRYLDDCSAQFISSYDSLPEHLAFDEFRGVGRKLHFICQDGEKHTIVAILKDRFKNTIIKYFEQFPETVRRTVKTVSMDLNCYYGDIVRQIFPNAEVVIDRFHMVQMVNRSFTGFRVQVMKQLDKRSREYKLLKRYWKLYLKKYKELEGTQQFYDSCLKVPYTQAQIVDEGLKCDKTLRNTYDFMQDFMYALADKDTKMIEDLLDRNTSQYCEQLRKTIRTFRKNRRAVINGARMLFSNGCLEGVNRRIKQIERTAYGYSNFTHLLKRIRLEQNAICFKKGTKQTSSV